MLTYNETSIPATSLSERLQLALRENLALEVANTGNFPLELYQQYSISSVQAYKMHEFHPIHRDRIHRQEALRHVRDTIEIAAKLNVPRIVTVCGFGFELADRPFERCLEFFSSLVNPAKTAGVRIAIEPLSPLRVGAIAHPCEVAHLIEILNQPSVFSTVLDTGHLLDSGIELNAFFANWNAPIEELQLKGPGSAPPDAEMPVKQWLDALSQLPAVVCVEHRQPIDVNKFVELVGILQKQVSGI